MLKLRPLGFRVEDDLQNLGFKKKNVLRTTQLTKWINSELSSLSYSFNCAMCRIGLYKIDLYSLSTMYYYTG